MPRTTRKSRASKKLVEDDFSSSSSVEAPLNPIFRGSKNVRSAIENANQARELARKLDEDDRRGRDSRRSQIMGAFNGNAPWSPDWLRSQGLDWHFNCSFNHMAGVMGRATVPYTRFGLDVRYLTKFTGDLQAWRLDRTRTEYVKAIKRWGRWSKFYTRLVQELNLFGWDVAYWLDESTPFPEFSQQARCFVPDESPNDINDIDVMVIKKYYLIHQLYDKIADEDQAKKSGWNVKNVQACLMSARPKRLETTRNFEEFQKAIRGGYIYWSYSSAKVIPVYHVLVRELSGKVSQWAVEWRQGDSEVQQTYGKLENSGLFHAYEQFDSMSQVGVYFDAEPGDGCWHGPRGVGQRAYNTHVNRDKLMNQIMTSTLLSMMLPLKVPDELRGADLDTYVQLPFCQLPSGVEMLTERLPGVTQDIFATDALLTSNAEQTMGDVVPSGRAPNTTSGEKTATQSTIDARRQDEMRQSGIERFVDPFAKMHGEIFRRLTKVGNQNKDAKEFQRRLREQNVIDNKLTLSVMQERIEVASFYEIKDVTGEAAAASQVIFQEMRGDPMLEQKPIYEDRIRAIMGPEAVLRYLPEEANKVEFAEAVRKQQMENAAIMLGQPIEVMPGDKHEAEAPEVIRFITEQFNQAAQGGNSLPIPVIEALIEHAKKHLLAMSQDKRYKQLSAQLSSQLGPLEQMIQKLKAVSGMTPPEGATPQSVPPNRNGSTPLAPQTSMPRNMT